MDWLSFSIRGVTDIHVFGDCIENIVVCLLVMQFYKLDVFETRVVWVDDLNLVGMNPEFRIFFVQAFPVHLQGVAFDDGCMVFEGQKVK